MIINVKQRELEQQALRLANRTEEQVIADKILSEKAWRDSQLKNSDYIISLKDHSKYYAYIVYRVALRNYPDTLDFPNGVRPVLDETIKNSLSKYEFMSRFTTMERIAITASVSQSPELTEWLNLFKLTDYINLNDNNTIEAVTILEQLEIIGVGRAAEILS